MTDTARRLIERILDDLADAGTEFRGEAARAMQDRRDEDYMEARGDEHEVEEMAEVLEGMLARCKEGAAA